MKRCKLQRQLDAILARAQREEQRVIDAAYHQYVVPYCKRTGADFCAGMGSWSFHWPDGRQLGSYDEKSLPKRLWAAVTADTLNNGQDAGSLMSDYRHKKAKP